MCALAACGNSPQVSADAEAPEDATRPVDAADSIDAAVTQSADAAPQTMSDAGIDASVEPPFEGFCAGGLDVSQLNGEYEVTQTPGGLIYYVKPGTPDAFIYSIAGKWRIGSTLGSSNDFAFVCHSPTFSDLPSDCGPYWHSTTMIAPDAEVTEGPCPPE